MPRRRKPGDPTLAIAYLRVSTDKQDLGPEAQRTAIHQWAKREGVTLIAEHLDKGVSGATPVDQRPGFLAALADLRERRAGVFVVARRDRLAREVIVAATAERAVEQAGAIVVSADGVANGDDEASRFMRDIMNATASFQRRLIAANTKRALAEKRRKGERISRRPPYGLRVGPDGVQLEPDRDEQRVIATVLRLRKRGKVYREIVEHLTAQGIVGRTGNPLGIVQVNRIVQRAAEQEVSP